MIADTPQIAGVPFVRIDDRGGARAAARTSRASATGASACRLVRLREDDRMAWSTPGAATARPTA